MQDELVLGRPRRSGGVRSGGRLTSWWRRYLCHSKAGGVHVISFDWGQVSGARQRANRRLGVRGALQLFTNMAGLLAPRAPGGDSCCVTAAHIRQQTSTGIPDGGMVEDPSNLQISPNHDEVLDWLHHCRTRSTLRSRQDQSYASSLVLLHPCSLNTIEYFNKGI